MKKQSICVIFGGVSPEHEVSCRSGAMVLEHIDRERYDVWPVGIRKDGAWLLTTDCPDKVRSGAWTDEPQNRPVVFSPSRLSGEAGLLVDGEWRRPDCVFPILHGENGEDGSMQGLFTLAGIPFVGCGVTASALCMDKIYTKMICSCEGIAQAEWVAVTDPEETAEAAAARVEARFAYPVFVKPVNTGSSVGVSKAKDRAALIEAISLARRYDSRVLVEEFIDGFELETAVLGNGAEIVSGIGQIVPTQEFYSYDAKYNDETSALVFDPPIPAEKTAELRRTAARVFRLLGCRGLSRVDFFLRKSDGQVIFNEINTLPGFTSISMYPKLIERLGISNTEMITRLIEAALTRQGGCAAHG
ncbi:MAG: D-alanine--D-alanine ligase A [Clostridiales bacterium]|nr:MAG: D-alanine--D-alanine ligase A [Clostridiales bacterium]